jgi:hypothetical protein
MIHRIEHEGTLFAIIIPAEYSGDGIEFFTDPSLSQQLAYMKRKEGYRIKPHTHLPVPRQVIYTQETLFVRRGCVRVNFYDKHDKYLTTNLLGAGDCILLIAGGHGFEFMKDSEVIEVKQGPYIENDKRHFSDIRK